MVDAFSVAVDIVIPIWYTSVAGLKIITYRVVQ